MKNAIILLAISFFVFFAADYASSIPIVEVSHSSDQCVRVVNFESSFQGSTEYTCDNMPTKYSHVWVK